MALSPAEKQKRYRDRQKEKERFATDLSDRFVRGGFSEFLENDPAADMDLTFVWECCDSVGLIEKTTLKTDADPEWREEWATPYRGSLGRAERMVGAMIDSAKALAGIINRFKLREIDAAIAALQTADLTDEAARKQALADAVQLNAIRERLTKEVRHSFPQYRVTGEEL